MTHKSDQDNQQDIRSFSINYKMIPLIIVYQLWVIAIIQAFGWAPAIPACIVTGGWLSAWPKGLLKNILFFFVFAIVLPLSIVVGLGLEASSVSN